MTPERLFAALDGTWSPVEIRVRDGWVLRRGAGGGKRVSAATVEELGALPDIPAAEAQMARMGQAPLFMIRAGDDALDAALARRGYVVVDPVVAMAAPAAQVAALPDDPLAAIDCTAPLAIMAEIWAAGGIGAARLAVMARSGRQRCYMLGRARDRAAGCLFVASDARDGRNEPHGSSVAMVHALEVAPGYRRGGVARQLVEKAALWAHESGASTIAAVTLERNAAARGLFRRLGFTEVAAYHYRARESADD